MKIIVKLHDIEIEKKDKVNENEYKITKCEFEFSEEYTNDLVKVALFTNSKGTYKNYIINNECDIPFEILKERETCTLGVYAYKEDNEELILRYSPEPIKFYVTDGSYKENAENTEPITPSDKEQIEQMLTNINISAEKVGRITTITYVNKDGIEHEITLEDGKSIEYNWRNTELGIKREGETEYQYVDLQGPKGEPGAIKIQIVQVLPQTGQDDTIYLVPLEEPESQENKYAEYIWVNSDWELLGKIGIEIDLTDYYTKQEVDSRIPTSLSQLSSDSTHRTVSDTEKSTWNNKSDFSGNYNDLTNKPNIPTKTSDLTNDSDFTTKAYVDGLVGDIATTLDTINREVI